MSRGLAFSGARLVIIGPSNLIVQLPMATSSRIVVFSSETRDHYKRPEDVIHWDCSSHQEGTAKQAKLGPSLNPKRKHFFSQVDPVIAGAVHQDAETVEYSVEEEV